MGALEILFRALEWIETTEGITALIWRYSGARRLARYLLSRRRRVVTAGLEFFQDRDTLDQHRTWTDLITSVKEIDALFVVGDNAIRQGEDLHKIKRILLPNPQSRSVKYFAETMKIEIPQIIRNSTQLAQKVGIQVRWLDEFLGYSIVLIDKNEETARVHIEMVMAPIKPSKRPSVTIWKRRFPKVFNEYRAAYDALWDVAKPLTLPPSFIQPRVESGGC